MKSGTVITRSVPPWEHGRGEPCPVAALLIDHFGEKRGGYLLYEFTCFPMSDEHAWRQAHALVGADLAGVLPGFLAAQRVKQDAAMDDRVEPWYRQNLLLATRGRTDTVPRSLVHPAIWEHRRP